MKYDEKQNESEAYPFHEKVIIKHLPVDETFGEMGVFQKSEMQLNRELATQVKSKIIAIGELAFEELVDPPQVGDIIYTSKATGFIFFNSKGDEYRFLYDKDCIGMCYNYIPPVRNENAKIVNMRTDGLIIKGGK